MWLDRIDPAFGYWFAGLVDGEGCFYIRRSGTDFRGQRYIGYGCSLSFAMRDDDLAVLEMVRDTLGMGVISRYQPNRSRGQKPVATLSIHNKQDVLRLVALFERFPLRSKKRRDFEIWRRAVAEWHRTRGGKGRPRDWTAMEALHQELKAVRRYIAI